MSAPGQQQSTSPPNLQVSKVPTAGCEYDRPADLHILDLHGSEYHTADERNPLTAQSHNLLVAAAEQFAQHRDCKGQKHSQ